MLDINTGEHAMPHNGSYSKNGCRSFSMSKGKKKLKWVTYMRTFTIDSWADILTHFYYYVKNRQKDYDKRRSAPTHKEKTIM